MPVCCKHTHRPTQGCACAGMERSIGVDFADIFAHSDMEKRNEALIERESQPREGAQPLSFNKQYARTTSVQVKSLESPALLLVTFDGAKAGPGP